MKFKEKKDICVGLLFVSFTNFKVIQGFYKKFQAISRVQGAVVTLYKNKQKSADLFTNKTLIVLFC